MEESTFSLIAEILNNLNLPSLGELPHQPENLKCASKGIHTNVFDSFESMGPHSPKQELRKLFDFC